MSPPMTQDVEAIHALCDRLDDWIAFRATQGQGADDLVQAVIHLRAYAALQHREGLAEGERERIARDLLSGLREQNPDLTEESRETVWLSGGCTPQSRGTIINLYDLADAILGAKP